MLTYKRRKKTKVVKRCNERIKKRLYIGAIVLIVYSLFIYIQVKEKKDNLTGYDINYTESEFGLENNIEIISKIRKDESWNPLSLEERTEVLQAISNCEANYYGFDFHVDIVLADLEREVHADYNTDKKEIRIDREFLADSNAESAMLVILHEMHHAWQYCLVKLYLDSDESQRKLKVFEHCKEYVSEMKDYKRAGDDFESFVQYKKQYLEIDCTKYSIETIDVYYAEIDEILK